MIYYQQGSESTAINDTELKEAVSVILERIGPRKKVLIIPPDYTRFHSRAGDITSFIYDYYRERISDILPALGTHMPMTGEEISIMYRDVPHNLFRVHDWRNDVLTVGTVSGEFVSELTEARLSYPWPAQLNKMIVERGYDLIISVGQVVPHEVAGMANYNKNIFIGTGGHEGINKSHFIGAVYGMERMMGKVDTPVRRLLNFASGEFTAHLPLVYIHTVIGRDEAGSLAIRGLYAGDDEEVFLKAAELSVRVNFTVLDKPLAKVVVYLDPGEYKSTWLGNKAIYRTRMAMADDGELIILAPGLRQFGEDGVIDGLIRKYGYRGTDAVLRQLDGNAELENNLSAAAHLIHGSTEGRFKVTYCPGILSREEIESVNFCYDDLDKMMARYDGGRLREGFSTMPGGQEIFFISNPATGLWASKERLA
ncbi:MAG TPA: lactate racemase domain-containing protein [Bacteroidales bacterium]|nr:lactate racemase domain-containing protein [Bacteroidales bacterium]